jgi:hypothetical protein
MYESASQAGGSNPSSTASPSAEHVTLRRSREPGEVTGALSARLGELEPRPASLLSDDAQAYLVSCSTSCRVSMFGMAIERATRDALAECFTNISIFFIVLSLLMFLPSHLPTRSPARFSPGTPQLDCTTADTVLGAASPRPQRAPGVAQNPHQRKKGPDHVVCFDSLHTLG